MMIRVILLGFFLLAPAIESFVPFSVLSRSKTTVLHVSRRDALASVAAFALGAATPFASIAFQQQLEDHLTEPTQLPTSGKLDLNSAFVGDYMKLRGMYPTAAGKIASNGPYSVVSDIYQIPGLTKDDIRVMKKYDKLFTVNPPGRQFKERINARVST